MVTLSREHTLSLPQSPPSPSLNKNGKGKQTAHTDIVVDDASIEIAPNDSLSEQEITTTPATLQDSFDDAGPSTSLSVPTAEHTPAQNKGRK